MAETRALWSLSLDCTCPECGHDYDILEADPDFFSNSRIEPIESGTGRTKNFETACPECEHEFKVDFEY
jgi:rubredoxin